MRPYFFFLLVTSTPFMAGCSGPFACTDIGCISSATIGLTGFMASSPDVFPFTIETCLGQTCFTSTASLQTDGTPTCATDQSSPDVACLAGPLGNFQIDLPLPASSQTSGIIEAVTVKVRDSKGATLFTGQQLATVTKLQPNGPGCEPTCFGASADFTAK
jgi:hypothetical protein